MPGPGKKIKAKAKPVPAKPATATPTSDWYIGDIDHAEGWHMIVNILCDALEVPDITTRTGLKKVHADFEAIYRRLDKVCTRYSGNEKIVGGIIGIYAKMSVDSILRDKIFDKGLLSKLIPLLSIEFTRHMALRALATVTHHGSPRIHFEIAKYAHVLTKLVEEFPDDRHVAELAITVLSHSVCAILRGDKLTNPKLLASLDMRTILILVTENTKKEWASQHLINHAIYFLSSATLHASDTCKQYPPMIKLLVAGLRSKDWVTRCVCLGGIVRLYHNEAQVNEPTLDIPKYMACIQRGFPGHLQDLMMSYGLQRCETYLTLKTSGDYQKAMMTCVQDHNLYALGIKLAEFILRTEFSIADGAFETENPTTGKREILDVGLPFRSWLDALPVCANAIRAKGGDKVDLADILEIKYYVMRRNIPRAVELARKGLKRNPDCAYFYYAITLSADNVEGLRAAKKGLKCRNITPFVRFQMMQRAVTHAGDMGIQILQNSPTAGKAKWEEGIAFLMSALDDAETFIAQAPPDNRHMNPVLYWYILLTITIKESALSTDLRELSGALKASKVADDFNAAIDAVTFKTELRLAQAAVVNLYPAAVKEYGDVIAKATLKSSQKPVVPERLVDDLAAWLEDTHVDDEPSELTSSHPIISTNFVELYQCSWCGNPSAILRKCGGCSKTRYCDAGCQKTHWKTHKKTCNVNPV